MYLHSCIFSIKLYMMCIIILCFRSKQTWDTNGSVTSGLAWEASYLQPWVSSSTTRDTRLPGYCPDGSQSHQCPVQEASLSFRSEILLPHLETGHHGALANGILQQQVVWPGKCSSSLQLRDFLFAIEKHQLMPSPGKFLLPLWQHQ